MNCREDVSSAVNVSSSSRDGALQLRFTEAHVVAVIEHQLVSSCGGLLSVQQAELLLP